MRISDWSSDVCSSDRGDADRKRRGETGDDDAPPVVAVRQPAERPLQRDAAEDHRHHKGCGIGEAEADPASVNRGQADRKGVVYGKSVSVRVNIGGPRTYKKTKQQRM